MKSSRYADVPQEPGLGVKLALPALLFLALKSWLSGSSQMLDLDSLLYSLCHTTDWGWDRMFTLLSTTSAELDKKDLVKCHQKERSQNLRCLDYCGENPQITFTNYLRKCRSKYAGLVCIALGCSFLNLCSFHTSWSFYLALISIPWEDHLALAKYFTVGKGGLKLYKWWQCWNGAH